MENANRFNRNKLADEYIQNALFKIKILFSIVRMKVIGINIGKNIYYIYEVYHNYSYFFITKVYSIYF